MDISHETQESQSNGQECQQCKVSPNIDTRFEDKTPCFYGIHISFRTNFICTDKLCPTVIAKIFIDILIFAPIIELLLKNHSMTNIVHLVEEIGLAEHQFIVLFEKQEFLAVPSPCYDI